MSGVDVRIQVAARAYNALRFEANLAEINLIHRNIVPRYVLEDPAFQALGLPEPCERRHVVLHDGWTWDTDGREVYLKNNEGVEVYRHALQHAPLRF